MTDPLLAAGGPANIAAIETGEGVTDPAALWGDPVADRAVWAAHDPYDLAPRLLGLPGGWPHLTFPPAEGEPARHWKLGAIESWAGPDTPLAWIDDAFDASCKAWAAARAARARRRACRGAGVRPGRCGPCNTLFTVR